MGGNSSGGSSSDSLDSLVAGGEGRRASSERARERASGASLGAQRGFVSSSNTSRWRLCAAKRCCPACAPTASMSDVHSLTGPRATRAGWRRPTTRLRPARSERRRRDRAPPCRPCARGPGSAVSTSRRSGAAHSGDSPAPPRCAACRERRARASADANSRAVTADLARGHTPGGGGHADSRGRRSGAGVVPWTLHASVLCGVCRSPCGTSSAEL